MSKIYTKTVMQWDGQQYVLDVAHSEYIEYNKEVTLCCGATGAQNNIQAQQQAAYSQATQQAQQVFGQDSAVFNDLMNTFAPTVAAGPNQQGFSAAENANLNSQAITQTGQAYKNEKQALGETEAAQGGGTTGLPSGASIGANLGLAENAGNQTASELSGITQANYAQGRQNYDTAAAGLGGATGAFNSATSATGASTGAGSAASNTANQIAQEQNSWVQSVTGALGGVAGAAMGNIGGIGSAIGSITGNSSNANPYQTLSNAAAPTGLNPTNPIVSAMV